MRGLSRLFCLNALTRALLVATFALVPFSIPPHNDGRVVVNLPDICNEHRVCVPGFQRVTPLAWLIVPFNSCKYLFVPC